MSYGRAKAVRNVTAHESLSPDLWHVLQICCEMLTINNFIAAVEKLGVVQEGKLDIKAGHPGGSKVLLKIGLAAGPKDTTPPLKFFKESKRGPGIEEQ